MSKVTKARVKATGEIIRVSRSTGIVTEDGKHLYNWYEVETLDSFDEHYWTRLEHTYAGMAMQQLVTLVNVGYEYVYEETAIIATNFAHALVQKLKEKEERK